MPLTWVIGASGLLGRHTSLVARQRGHRVQRSAVPWAAGTDVALDALRAGTEEMLLRAADGDRWHVVWVAGAGVVGSSAEELAGEQAAYRGFLAHLAESSMRWRRPPGSLFFASSAGGVYAGSAGPPFTEATAVSALAAYGINKLAMEAATADFAAATGLPAMIGRIANLYGPGQNTTKPQGLVSQLARGYLLRTPILLYVSLDTLRDYLYVGDCAQMIVRAGERLAAEGVRSAPLVKILASGRSTTIAELLGIFQRTFKRRAPTVLGDSPNKRFQVRDLRLRSTVWTDLDRLARTPLPAGVGATIADLAGRLRTAELLPGQ